MKNPIVLILFGLVRHFLTTLGGVLVARGILTDDELAAWLSPAIETTVGWVIIAVGVAWSAINKKAVIEWVRKALRINVAETAPALKAEVEKREVKRAMTPFVPILALALLLPIGAGVTACRSIADAGGAITDLIPHARITDPETAKRALVIAENVRIAARDYLAREVMADRKVDAEEMKMIAKFDKYDDVFTRAWRFADEAVGQWSRGADGDAIRERFMTNYMVIEDLLLIPNGMRDLDDLRSANPIPMTYSIH